MEIWEIGTNVFDGGLLNFGIHAAGVLLLAWIGCRIARKLTNHLSAKTERNEMAFRYMYRVISALFYVIAVFSILNRIRPMAGIGTAFLTTTSVVTVIAGLAAQATVGNLISGVVIAIYHPFHVGDFVSLPEKGIAGKVEEITFRHTVLRTPEMTRLTVPNSVMDGSVIEDRTSAGKIYRKFIKFTVGYDTDTAKMRSLISDIVTAHPAFADARTLEQKEEGVPAVSVRIDDFSETGMLVTCVIHMKSYDASFDAASDIRTAIQEAFRQNGISFAAYRINQVNKA